MVFYFTSSVVEPAVTLFMGAEKHENEELIRWGWPEDVWFHVDKVSSAHVYLRLKRGETLDDIPSRVLVDAVQLCKANSISGNKMNDVDVVYTLWSNLKKTPGMDVGQVGFHRQRDVRKVRVEKRANEIINRLNKTRTERAPDLREQRELRDRDERGDKKQVLLEQKQREREAAEEREREKQLRSYATLFESAKMSTNQDSGNDSDDFM
ncbi:PREDICTED: coiled-coil domain-containing protein 25-like [Priapulus caudatus]|uniref:Coiled-coil domain-containing protein 25 n=1 Tax=Priapulus caudatus TaxID=37621 RepID=A0ABM1F9N6_PRICU|nr:PREDICTED: coiled-coil domain-containing protein 25-like [Priapulus caudatus]XP_014681158.1 PREDICTED: coiled-coil domain-containing protein 25-like [Priapulus caudatus]